MRAIRRVHVVAKSHLDLGFTALAAEVEAQYLTEYFPRALATAAELRARGGDERLVWTTGSWILGRAVAEPDGPRSAAVAAGVERGDLAWHALPFTTHTELMDAALFRHGLSIAEALDARFARHTSSAKMTDVPGHARSVVPLLAEAGVTFLHLGVNPAWPTPDVPAVFRWRAPDGSEVTVAYQGGGYGGEVVVPGCAHALAFLHAGDNHGPPTPGDVVDAHAELRARYPDAVVGASTLCAFARALEASGVVQELPVVTSEIGDPWLFGAGSDPTKMAGYRRALAARVHAPVPVRAAVDDRLLLVAEHTWGLDQKVALPEEQPWDDRTLSSLRSGEEGRRFQASWDEQRAYVDEALALLGVAVEPTPEVEGEGWESLEPEAELLGDGWRVALGADGALVRLECRSSGRTLADEDHPLGRLSHQRFDEAAYEAFYEQLAPEPADEWWARRDNTKPGIAKAGAQARWSTPRVVAARARRTTSGALEVVGELELEPLTGLRCWWRFDADGHQVDVTWWWADKAPTRLPEAWWCSFVPLAAEPQRWELDKVGQRVDPTDVVRRGGRALHAVGEGCWYGGADGTMVLRSPDAPLVAPGAPRLLDADPPPPDLAGGMHVLVHDNCWGTNFPMWWGGPACFRFSLALG